MSSPTRESSRSESSGASQPRPFLRCLGVCGGPCGCVVRGSAVLLDIIAEVVVRMPATRRRGRNAGPRRGMNALGTGAGSESPGRFSRLDRQKHCVPSHLCKRDLPKDYDRHASPANRVSRCIYRVFHAVTRCPWRRKARTLATGAEPTRGRILWEDGVDDRDGRPHGQGRVSGLEAEPRARRILIRYENPQCAVWRHDGHRSRRSRDFLGTRLPPATERDEGDDGTKAKEANALGTQLLLDGSRSHISPVSRAGYSSLRLRSWWA